MSKAIACNFIIKYAVFAPHQKQKANKYHTIEDHYPPSTYIQDQKLS